MELSLLLSITLKAAAVIGVDPGTLTRWERGEKEPTCVYLARVNNYLSAQPQRGIAASVPPPQETERAREPTSPCSSSLNVFPP